MAKRLFVGGLPYSLTQDELKEMFDQVGKVTNCNLITDKFTNLSKGFAFVEMDKDSDADKAIETLNGKEVGGRNIAVSIARPREDRSTGGYSGGDRREFRKPDHNHNGNTYKRGSRRY